MFPTLCLVVMWLIGCQFIANALYAHATFPQSGYKLHAGEWKIGIQVPSRITCPEFFQH